MNRINTTYRRLSESGDDDQQAVAMPDKLSEQVAAINRDWAEVHRLAHHMQGHDLAHPDEGSEEGQNDDPQHTHARTHARTHTE